MKYYRLFRCKARRQLPHIPTWKPCGRESRSHPRGPGGFVSAESRSRLFNRTRGPMRVERNMGSGENRLGIEAVAHIEATFRTRTHRRVTHWSTG
ncbi:hypothetical protein chiPu_0027271 [Chiloscyllium punctatum]|uniref:Uncharacterized protein n=1 Tax=Chiloscyllium punctatum TaxID=137246 RepID=A0A401TK42_CHIPU|nr:hypothetical protein [Chiloscyllium punctatum]